MMYGLDFERLIKFATLLVSCIGDTKHGCENSIIHLGCTNNENFEITSAWYGRTDNTICSHPTVSQSTRSCQRDEKQRAIQQCKGSVDQDNKCTIKVDNSKFEPDPCPGVFKHLTVVFQCDQERTTVDFTTRQHSFTSTRQHTSTDLLTTTTVDFTTTQQHTSTDLLTTYFVPSSEAPPTTTAVNVLNTSQTTNPICMCSCRLFPTSNVTPISQTMAEMLKVDKEKLSSSIRKKISVYEDRPSAKGIGFVAIFFLVVAASLVIVPDTINVIQFIQNSVKAKNR